MHSKIRINEILSVYHNLLSSAKVLFIPFLIIAFCDSIALTLIYLAPRYPISIILAPPIRKFWGEQFLHYPQNFSLIPRLFNYAHIFILFTLGIYFTGIFIKMCHIYFKTKKNILKVKVLIPSCIIAIKKFIPMVIFFAIFYSLTMYSFNLISYLFDNLNLVNRFVKIAHLASNFILVLFLQSIFAFMFPALIVSNVGLIKAFKINFMLVFKNFWKILFVIFIPSILYALITINKYFMPRLVEIYEPEVIVLSLGFGIFITMLIDLFISGYTTVFYLLLNKDTL